MEPKPTSQTFTHYIFFWIGQLISMLGSSVTRFVIITWIGAETLSPTFLSIAFFLSALPMVIIPPLIGVYIDRWNRKITIIMADSLQAFTTFMMIIFFMTNMANYWLIISLNVVRAICQAIHFPTVNAIIPIMIPKKHLSRMNAINYLFTGGIQILGPIIGGIFLTIVENNPAIKIEHILWIDIITFGIALIPLLAITIPSVVSNSDKTKKITFIKDFKFGLNVLKSVKSFLILIIFISFINLLNMPFSTQLLLFVLINHSGTVLDYSIITALLQIGFVIGAIIATVKKHWKHKELIILYSCFIGITGYSLLTIAPKGYFIMMAIGALIQGFMIPIANTMFLTILQTKIPAETQGRVFSIVASIAAAVTPLGMLISGPIADLIGIQLLFIFALYLQFVAIVITWYFTDLKNIIKAESKQEQIIEQEEIKLRPEQIEY
ncbi:MAG: MFS transporter [Candidatus Lokiarchaeia archaeon]|nr:MFS transporter [Candidatus Lokiarchaeia archaeon]